MRIKEQIPKTPSPKKQHRSAAIVKPGGDKHMLPWMLAISLVFTLIAFLPGLKAGFANLDDPGYVLDNMMIRDFGNIKAMFFTHVLGNYHPLTMISLAFNYAISGLNPFSYHFVNLLLHLLNVALVFLFIMRLSNGKAWIAFITALLFGIHPMHVESVVWITERKDVLYTAFFLAGMISYMAYVREGKIMQLLLTVLWFVLSLMSKPAAIIFPFVLFALDFYLRRKFSVKIILEKLPMIIISAAFVWLTLGAQAEAGAMGLKEAYPLDRRFFFGNYGFVMYILKMFLPVNLSPFYPFPSVNVPLPAFYFVSPLLVLLILGAAVYSLRKTRVIVFGLLFYGLNIILVLQFFVVGGAVISDRYTYMSYIGLFFIIGYGIQYLLDHRKGTGQLMVAVFAVMAVLFTGMTFARATQWQDNIVLWKAAVVHNPSSRAYEMLGLEYKRKGNIDMALDSYNKAIAINKVDAISIVHRGVIYYNREQWDLAMADFNTSLTINPDNHEALVNRAAIYSRNGTYDKALIDFARAEKVKPDYDQLYFNRSLTYLIMEKFRESISDCEKYLEFQPEDADVINSIGVCYSRLGEYKNAVAAYDRAIKIKNDPTFVANRAEAARNLVGK